MSDLVTNDDPDLTQVVTDIADFDLAGEVVQGNHDVVRGARYVVRTWQSGALHPTVIGGVYQAVTTRHIQRPRAVQEYPRVAGVPDLGPRQDPIVARRIDALNRLGSFFFGDLVVMGRGHIDHALCECQRYSQ